MIFVSINQLKQKKGLSKNWWIPVSLCGGADETRTRDLRRDSGTEIHTSMWFQPLKTLSEWL